MRFSWTFVKNCCTRAVASGRVTIQKASDMVKFCCENLTVNKLSDDCYHLLRSFVQIDTVNIDRHVTSESLKTLTGSRSLHAMRPDRNQWGKIMKKQQSCFCSDCLEGRRLQKQSFHRSLDTCSCCQDTAEEKCAFYTLQRGRQWTPRWQGSAARCIIQGLSVNNHIHRTSVWKFKYLLTARCIIQGLSVHIHWARVFKSEPWSPARCIIQGLSVHIHWARVCKSEPWSTARCIIQGLGDSILQSK